MVLSPEPLPKGADLEEIRAVGVNGRGDDRAGDGSPADLGKTLGNRRPALARQRPSSDGSTTPASNARASVAGVRLHESVELALVKALTPANAVRRKSETTAAGISKMRMAVPRPETGRGSRSLTHHSGSHLEDRRYAGFRK